MAHRKKRKKSEAGVRHNYHHKNVDAGVESWSAKNPSGDVEWKRVSLPPEVQELLAEISDAYEREFGSPPPATATLQKVAELAGVPLPTETECRKGIADAMRLAGARPEVIYAFCMTGLIVTEDNQHLIDDEDLEAWEEAVEEVLERGGEGAKP